MIYRQRSVRVCLGAICFLLLFFPASGSAVLLSDFNNSGFSYSYGGFVQQPGATSTRLFDPNDGWGASVRNANLDLSSLTNGRIVVDFTPNVNHQADLFVIQLNDANGLSGRWEFNTGGLQRGQPTQLTSVNTLSNPNGVYDGTGFVNTLPDFSNITNWAVEGQWASTVPFDVTFDNLEISTTAPPPPPYTGYDANAPWRAQAATQIDSVRKANLDFIVLDAIGNRLPHAGISVQQQSHAFGFGGAIQANLLGNNSGADATTKARVKDYFNVVTIENNLKWPPLEGDWGSNFTAAKADEALRWIEAEGLEARGHTMVWPGAGNLPNSLQSLVTSSSLTPQQQQVLRDTIAQRITDVSNLVDGRVVAWDVVNEPRTNHDVMDLLDEGDAAMADWFQQARSLNPNARLVLNDYGILSSGGGTSTANQLLLESQVQALQLAGAPIDGVGLQGHFSDGNLTGPEQLWQIVDRYDALGVGVEVTEFDFATDDEQLKADYVRDFYTAMFAHEGVDRIITWVPRATWSGNADRAMFNSDWSPKLAGQEYLDLVFDEWWSDEMTETDVQGEGTVRAFKGVQGVTASFGGETDSVDVTLSQDGDIALLSLDLILGDFNRDGTVDAADFTTWRDTLGSQVAAGFGADGDGNGIVELPDLDVWKANFGATLPVAATVPEPEAAVLAILFALVFACRSRGKRS